MAWSSFVASGVVLALLLAPPLRAQQHEHASSTNEKFGTVSFATSCTAPHSRSSIAPSRCSTHSSSPMPSKGSTSTLKTDPSCAMAEWGVALSRWSNPFAPGLRPAGTAPAGARRCESRQSRSEPRRRARRAYLDAVAQLYTSFETIDQRTRTLAYRDAMAGVAAANPNDTEASIFHALAIAAAALPTDKTYAEQLKAGAILEKIIARQPDHPGLAHYIIHSYDFPPLANRALDAARRYAKIAPVGAARAPHAVAHVHSRWLLAGVDRQQPRVRCGREACRSHR